MGKYNPIFLFWFGHNWGLFCSFGPYRRYFWSWGQVQNFFRPTYVNNHHWFWKNSPIFLFLIWPDFGPLLHFLGRLRLFFGPCFFENSPFGSQKACAGAFMTCYTILICRPYSASRSCFYNHSFTFLYCCSIPSLWQFDSSQTLFDWAQQICSWNYQTQIPLD